MFSGNGAMGWLNLGLWNPVIFLPLSSLHFSPILLLHIHQLLLLPPPPLQVNPLFIVIPKMSGMLLSRSQSVLIKNDSLQPLKLHLLQLKLLLRMRHHHMKLHYRSTVRNNINNVPRSWPMAMIHLIVIGNGMDQVNIILPISQPQWGMVTLSWWTVWLLKISYIKIKLIFIFPITLFTHITI